MGKTGNPNNKVGNPIKNKNKKGRKSKKKSL
jgi:hypothetical protein